MPALIPYLPNNGYMDKGALTFKLYYCLRLYGSVGPNQLRWNEAEIGKAIYWFGCLLWGETKVVFKWM